ncbi:TerD family protein [Kitasatospora paracochleata]|uniref:TerD domain-containing protein n=1 Tax=Kitasatospora paracochleata TaxID=58354 RepID=A0ABT1J983_9ACTN|nr:hypothetical protein [Kitasatospora paracochleata]
MIWPRRTRSRCVPSHRWAEWKFRAIGQGYASGLRGIAQVFGVNG